MSETAQMTSRLASFYGRAKQPAQRNSPFLFENTAALVQQRRTATVVVTVTPSEFSVSQGFIATAIRSFGTSRDDAPLAEAESTHE
jgi:hypothetical protein